jgi:hypothetical protein
VEELKEQTDVAIFEPIKALFASSSKNGINEAATETT